VKLTQACALAAAAFSAAAATMPVDGLASNTTSASTGAAQRVEHATPADTTADPTELGEATTEEQSALTLDADDDDDTATSAPAPAAPAPPRRTLRQLPTRCRPASP
jgi:hypothetical protein